MRKEQKEKARLLSNLLVEFNDYANYFDEDIKNCYIDVVNFVASGNSIRHFKSIEYDAVLLEEVLANVKAYLSPSTHKHSELFYFTQELSRLRNKKDNQ